VALFGGVITFWPAIAFCAALLVLDWAYVHLSQQRKSLLTTWTVIQSQTLHKAILYLNCVAMCLVILRIIAFILFDGLRPIEYEHLLEKTSVSITDTFLLLVLMRSKMNKDILMPLGFLILSKWAKWLLEDRLEYIESRLTVPAWSIIRICFVLFAIVVLDLTFTIYFALGLKDTRPKIEFAFLLEYFLCFVNALNLAYNYFLFAYEDQVASHEDNSFNKPLYVLYGNLIAVGTALVAQCMFFVLLVTNLMFPFISIRSFVMNLQDFRKYLKSIVHSRRAIQLQFPDATAEELANYDSTCIICREEMNATPANVNSQCKKLPCGHILHSSCLRSWLQRQQVCPLCRAQVMTSSGTPVAPPRNRNNNERQAGRENRPPAAAAENDPIAAAERLDGTDEEIEMPENPANGGSDDEARDNNNNREENLNPRRDADERMRRNENRRRTERNARRGERDRNGRHSRTRPTTSSNVTVDVEVLKTTLGAISESLTSVLPYSIPMPEIPRDFDSISEEALTLLEQEMSQSVRARVQHLCRVQNMINSTTLLMQSYENIASELTNRPQNQDSPDELANEPTDSSVQRMLNIVNDDLIALERDPETQVPITPDRSNRVQVNPVPIPLVQRQNDEANATNELEELD